jgi:pimeloyl-ACP methyl ester carboxylesterase
MALTARAVDRARIAWHQSGEGETLLLISGQSVDHTAWDGILPALAQHHRVIRFDHRGVGDSDLGSEELYSTQGFARDSLAVLDAAGVERAHILGHSMGGRVAQWLAIDHPGRVVSVVLAATTGGDARGVPSSASAAADLASGDSDRLARQFFRDARRREDAAAFFDRRSSPRVKRLHFQASRDHDTWDLLSTITTPALVIHGADDEVTPPSNAARIASLIPDAELALIPSARHGFYLDYPIAIDLILDFLRRHSAAAAASECDAIALPTFPEPGFHASRGIEPDGLWDASSSLERRG